MSLPDRLSRLLFIVPYVVQRDGVPLGELATLLAVSVKQIEADLDLLMMVGRPPLTPDHLIDIYVENDIVYVELDQSLSRPPLLTHAEAQALVLGAKLVGEQGGLGQVLQGAINKIMALLDPAIQEEVRAISQQIEIGQASESQLHTELRRAIALHRQITFTYFSPASDRAKLYCLEPLALITHSGIVYLVALDTKAGHQEKLFRLDRMSEMQITAQCFAPPKAIDLEKYRRSTLYLSKNEDFVATVRFSPTIASVAAERFAAKDCKWQNDGSLLVLLSTSSPAWLMRWVLPFGLDAEVLAPAACRQVLADLCRQAADSYR